MQRDFTVGIYGETFLWIKLTLYLTVQSGLPARYLK